MCGYKSAKFIEISDLLHSHDCVVCHYQNNFLNIEGPGCGENIMVQDQGQGECAKCSFMTELSFLMGELAPYQNPKEDSEFAYCAECEYPEPSVIPFGEYIYLCLNCLTLHDFAGKCRFCDEFNAGIDLETTYY